MAGKKGRSSGRGSQSSTGGERELVVIAKTESQLRAAPAGIASGSGADTASLSELLASEGGSLSPMFGTPEEKMDLATASIDAKFPDEPRLSQFYSIDAADDKLDDLAEKL